MLIRDYRPDDARAIVRLFYETIHTVNLADYTAEQADAWAPTVPDADAWNRRMSRRRTLVAERDGEVIGFADIENDGHIDFFFCRHDVVRQGVGTELYRAIEAVARGLGLGRVFTAASITARPFFERQGFRVLKRNTHVRHGVALVNYAMEKRLAAR